MSTQPGMEPMDFRVGYPGPFRVTIGPWPFDVDQIEAEVPFRRVPRKVFTTVEDFRAAYQSAPVEMQKIRVARSG
jgi:hypothetical protein